MKQMIGFLIWAMAGCLLILLGIRAFFAKKPVGFFAGVEVKHIKDMKGYNRATGWLFIGYGAFFILLGLPLLAGQNKPLILLSILGVMLETIVLMAVYNLVIANKYLDK